MIEAALDTSHGMALALIDDGKVLASEYLVPEGRQNRETLTPWLRKIFANCGLSANRVARWTIGLGPGSFTGIRMGAAFVKGVCLQSAGQICGIPTSYGMARQASADLRSGTEIAVLHDARRQQVIITVYGSTKSGLTPVLDAHIPEPDDLHKLCARCSRLVTLRPERVAAHLPELYRAKLVDLKVLRAENLLDASREAYQIEGAGDLSTQIAPVYVRPAVFVKPKPVRK